MTLVVVLHTHASSLNDSDGGIKLGCSLPSSHTVPATKPFQAAHAPCSVFKNPFYWLRQRDFYRGYLSLCRGLNTLRGRSNGKVYAFVLKIKSFKCFECFCHSATHPLCCLNFSLWHSSPQL